MILQRLENYSQVKLVSSAQIFHSKKKVDFDLPQV